jgi:peptidoglycan/LPS O-acetylase OafA/YrhL
LLDQPQRYFAPIDFRTRFPALDGLRAMAILAVFAAHYGGGSHGGHILQVINVIRGYGWLGVDLFFVLSGFLITGILYDTLGDGKYFQRFFARRSLRIFPIYYFVFALLLLLTPMLHYEWHWGHALFLVYLGNLIGNYNFAYYSVVSPRSTMMLANIGHFWSLCVEEQFYMLWPVAVFFLRKRRSLLIAGVSLSLLAIALRAGEFAWQGPVVAERWIVRTLPFRMDSLLIGGVLALLLRGENADRIQRSCKWLFLVGAAATAVVFALSPEYDSPVLLIGGYTIIALTCAGLVGCTLRTNSAAFRLFHIKSLRILGKYSYGFYIYHLLFRWIWIDFLVFLGVKLHSLALAGVIALSTNFVLTFLVSKYSYDLFESKFLKYKKHFDYDSEVQSHRHAFATK